MNPASSLMLVIRVMLGMALLENSAWVVGQGDPCSCNDTPVADDPNVITLAGIFDLTAYSWGRDVFEVTVQLLNSGHWGILNATDSPSIEYYMRDTQCDEITATRAYWDVRTQNGNLPPHGIVGCRCSGASLGLAKVSGLEKVPHVSQASNSILLSDAEKYPYFSRLVPPSDERGEAGALAAMMHHFGWQRVTTLETDLPFAKDLTKEFRRVWTTTEANDWQGKIAYSETVRTTSQGDVDMKDLRRALNNIPTDDPGQNSRIIFLAAHTQHAYPILEFAQTEGFQPDTIWVWGGREDTSDPIDFSWLPSVPGFFGVGPLQNRDEEYTFFLNELQQYQASQRPWVPLEVLPTFAAETVDSIRVLAQALAVAPDRRDGDAVVESLRSREYSGVSGSIEFTEIGDRKNPRFSIYNVQSNELDRGSIVWNEIGETGANFGSATLFDGISGACFAQVGCGLSSAPSDRYPEDPEILPAWIFIIIILLLLALLAMGFKYWRSRRSKKNYKKELEALRDSVVGMRAAEHTCICSMKSDPERGMPEAAIATAIPEPKWMWQETASYMDIHSDDKIWGDRKDCWVLYPSTSADLLEKAYQKGKSTIKLGDYKVDLTKMVQTKTSTGFARKVQRVVEAGARGNGTDSTDYGRHGPPVTEPNGIDMSSVKVCHNLPEDLEDEPQMVLVAGDLVQISQQRQDGWAFGTKLHHADEEIARQLAAVAVSGTGEDESNVFTDTGWFKLENTRIPTAEDLTVLHQSLSDTGALNAPSHWGPIKDPSIAQQHKLAFGTAERAAVEKAFWSTLRPPYFHKGIQVVNVERIENLAMWQSYVVKRQTICYRETGQAGMEDDDAQQKALHRFERKWLFHGCSYEVVDKILQQGFNRSFCGKNATMYGKGVYFARDACYSVQPTYSVPDRKGIQYILACRVVVGEYCRGKMDALTPDVRDRKNCALYDSTVDDLRNPSIYVTYHDAQAYPEYLITFKTTK